MIIREKLEWLEERFWLVYAAEIFAITILILYGIFSRNGFSAKGY